jgi:thiol:disulfide interchange protein DsbD
MKRSPACASRKARFSIVALLGILAVATAAPARAQLGGGAGAIPPASKIVQVAVAPLHLAPGGGEYAAVHLKVLEGWHINANPARDENTIPTELKFQPGLLVNVGAILYPPPQLKKMTFDENPLLVYDGDTEVKVPIVVDKSAPQGPFKVTGTVRFQACNDQLCLPPAELPVEIALVIAGAPVGGSARTIAPAGGAIQAGGAPGGAESSAVAPQSSGGFTSGPPPGGATGASIENPVARAIEAGGVGAFLALFLFGLALNLTPCVYPMLGVTVSIFGARRAAPPAQVIGYAALYVLGMALMYTTLGVVAALTGGLFGGFLQSPWVLAAIGVLLVAMSLSMFGLYEFTVPPGLMNRLGGATATSAAGVFLSGLVVGVFAAPCVGPAVVALLAVVGAKGDPWLGFTTFFTLSLGLGFPYLLLATFSNLLQKMPRSGEWMVWVKAVFGVILAGVGAFYLLLSLAPRQAAWVLPVALALGGIYLGFIERTKGRGPSFVWMKRAVGVAALAIAVFLVASAPREAIAFKPASDDALQAAVASGKPVLLEFSADWCVPCHELERATFSDRSVIGATRDFHAFKVDLTRYDSPESERWRRTWSVRGVPTVIFIGPDGHELRPLRVEGFIPPDGFLSRLRGAARGEAMPAAQQ